MIKLSVFVLANLFILVHSRALPKSFEKNPEDGDLFEGDIAGVEIIKGAAQITTASRVKWPNGVVPYIIDSVYNQGQIDIIMTGLKMIEDLTRINGKDCIRFVPKTTESTYIKVINDTGCYSYVGKQVKVGEQILSLRTPGCMVSGIVSHEFIHALGFWHEQSRNDRDQYVTINYENIEPGTENNFNKYPTSVTETLGFSYDYYSVMHYSDKSFSKNGEPTIVPKDPSAVIGQRKGPSPTDVAELRKYYGCTA